MTFKRIYIYLEVFLYKFYLSHYQNCYTSCIVNIFLKAYFRKTDICNQGFTQSILRNLLYILCKFYISYMIQVLGLQVYLLWKLTYRNNMYNVISNVCIYLISWIIPYVIFRTIYVLDMFYIQWCTTGNGFLDYQ